MEKHLFNGMLIGVQGNRKMGSNFDIKYVWVKLHQIWSDYFKELGIISN